MARVIRAQRPDDPEIDILLLAGLEDPGAEAMRNPLVSQDQKIGFAIVLLDRGETDQADKMIDPVWNSLQKNRQERIRLTAIADCVLGAIRSAQARYDEAEPLLQSAYQTLCKSLNPRHLATREAAGRLAALYHRWDKPALAEEFSKLAAPQLLSHDNEESGQR